ncbi:MAG: autotransporter outer membrane beta-barrel domain-containing protein [Alcaligenes nematophilus]|uniref:autotransporter outer membrane beta-barrel domain-containing protein n=1 Tax=Alcaligenes nematophilus TaxID=2994643 RepID=UPI003D024DB7
MKKTCLALALMALHAGTQAQGFSNTYFIGDSLTDSGQFGSRFTTNPGQVWSQVLAQKLGTDAAPSSQGGNNYAVGGARVAVDELLDPGKPPSPTNPPLPAMTTQTAQLLAMHNGRLDGQALYTVWGGANDLFAAVKDPFNMSQIVADSVGNQAALINTLSQAGARYILVPNIPDLGMTPEFAGSPISAGIATLLSDSYNQAFTQQLSSSSANIIPLNVSALLHEVATDPQAYGFSNVNTAACGSVSSRLCTPADLVAPGADQNYLFADGVHPTSGGHAVIADYAHAVVSAPSQVAMLASAANTAGQMQMQHIDRRLQTVSSSQDRDLAVWFQGEAITRNGSSANSHLDGTQAAWKLGLDKRLADWTVGAYLSYDNLDGDTDEKGTYSQKRQSAGLYGRWQAENLWVNAQLFYSDLDNKTRRHIRLGAATREHQAKAGGSQYGGKISTGYDWQAGAVTHGPLLSLSMQKSKIKALSEDGRGLSTSMGFDAQDQTSVQSSLGYQINVAVSHQWSVHASAQWLHEFKKPAELLGARLQDGVYNHRHFYLPTDQERVRDTGLLELGATGQLSNNWTLGAGVSTQVGKGTSAQTALYLNTAYRF